MEISLQGVQRDSNAREKTVLCSCCKMQSIKSDRRTLQDSAEMNRAPSIRFANFEMIIATELSPPSPTDRHDSSFSSARVQ